MRALRPTGVRGWASSSSSGKTKDAFAAIFKHHGPPAEEAAVPEEAPRSEADLERRKDVDAIFESLFGTARKRTSLEQLRFFPLYPRPVRRWVEDAKTRPGRFTTTGEWEEVESAAFQKDVPNLTRNAASDGIAFRRELPDDLVGKYRFGLRSEDVPPDAPPRVKDLLSFRWANQHEINTFRAKELAKRFERSPMDTGSSEVQVARMTVRIRALTEHMRAHHKDKKTKRALAALVSRRSALMRYLKRDNVEKYFQVITHLNLRDLV